MRRWVSPALSSLLSVLVLLCTFSFCLKLYLFHGFSFFSGWYRQDGDLIILGLATHEPHFCLLREEVIFGRRRLRQEALAQRKSKQERSNDYVLQTNFNLLHLNVLRDYIALDLETSNIYADSPYDIERTIDDFCFLTFFVGNDFLPHMPSLDIGDDAFDIMFHAYRKHRRTWWKNTAAGTKGDPYLTNGGKIVSGQRLELFLGDLGKHEDPFLWKAKSQQADIYNLIRKDDKKYGRNRRSTFLPSDEQLMTIEQKKLELYQQMLKSTSTTAESLGSAVTTGIEQMQALSPSSSTSSAADSVKVPAMLQNPPKMAIEGSNSETSEEEEDDFLKYLSGLVMVSISPHKSGGSIARGVSSTSGRRSRLSGRKLRASSVGNENFSPIKNDINGNKKNFDRKGKDQSMPSMEEGDLKRRYYFDKFGFSPLDVEQHQKLRRAYIEGLVWCLEYYYRGCVSWDWYYPYHYGPMFSDLVDLDTYLSEITFDGKRGQPLLPFEQLLACLPPSSSHLLPRPYRWLMTSDQSPIIEYYPVDFVCDTAGKRNPWEFTVLLPFIDGNKLSSTCKQLVTDDMLSDEEREMNGFGNAVILSFDSNKELSSRRAAKKLGVNIISYISKDPADEDAPRFSPAILPRTILPYPGFSTLMDAPLDCLVRRRTGVNVFGSGSRYRTAILKISKPLPPLPPIQILRNVFVGTTIYIRYPHFVEAFVTAISDESVTCRGDDPPRQWTKQEVISWKTTRDKLTSQYSHGDGSVGSGGWLLPESHLTLSVRPMQEIVAMNDGQKVKKFAKFEIEVPITAALWTPSSLDKEKRQLPLLLEKNPYKYGECERNGNQLSDSVDKEKSNLINNRNKAGINGIDTYKDYVGQKKQRLYSTLSTAKKNNCCYVDCYRPLAETSRRSSSLQQGGLGSLPKLSLNKCSKEKSALKFLNAPRSRYFAKTATAFAVLAFAVSKTAASSLPLATAMMDSKRKPWVSCIRGGDLAPKYQVQKELLPTPPLEFAHGTTTISFLFRDGIVAAVDSRASIGQFVGSKTVQKVLPIHKTMLGTMAGGAADCSYWIRKLRSEAKRFQLEDGDGRTLSVARASTWLSTFLYENRSLNLSVGTMIMGVDQHSGEASIYYTDDQGVRIRGDLFAVGSGSTFALGILDSETDPKSRLQLTEEDAVALAVKAIRHATFRDAYSGGYIGVYVVTKDGWKKVFSEDLALVTVGFDDKEKQ